MTWIKMRIDLREDPAVFRLAKMTRLDRLSVVGRLWAFWAWADKHAIEGQVAGADAADVDEIADKKGFAEALREVGWLTLGDGFVAIPKHDRHTGESAKERSLKNARQARWRRSRDVDVDGHPSTGGDGATSTQGDGEASTRASTRGEEEERKRREEKNTPANGGGNSTVATPAASVCRALRQAGIPNVNPSHPSLLALLAQGAELSQFVDAVPKAVGKSDPFAYLLGVVKGQLRDAQQTHVDVQPEPEDPDAWKRTRSGIINRANAIGFPEDPPSDQLGWQRYVRDVIAADAQHRTGAAA